VGLTRILAWLVPGAEQALLLSGIVGGAVGLLLLWCLGETMFSRKAGLLAAGLLAFNPAFWLAGIVTQSRVFLATASIAAGYVAWRAWQGGQSKKWFYVLSLVLGVGAGFRPDTLFLLFPLWVVTGQKGKRRSVEFVVATGLVALAVLSWLGYLLIVAGGPVRFYRTLSTYVLAQLRDTRILMGGSLAMAWAAVAWNGLGALSWIWALPLLSRRAERVDWRSVTPFLLVWFAPAFLFQALVHLGDADQTLVTIPVLCLLGGWVLPHWKFPLAAAMALNALLFFWAPTRLAQRSTYGPVAHFDRVVSPVLDALRQLWSQGPILVVSHWPGVSWRHLQYYFPDCSQLYFHGNLESGPDPSAAWLMSGPEVERVIQAGEEINLPARGRIVLLPPPPADPEFSRQVPLRRHGPLFYFDTEPGMRFKIGAYRFSTRSAPTALSAPRYSPGCMVGAEDLLYLHEGRFPQPNPPLERGVTLAKRVEELPSPPFPGPSGRPLTCVALHGKPIWRIIGEKSFLPGLYL